MAIVMTGFAQIKSQRKAMPKPAQKVTLTGLEERDFANFPASTRDFMVSTDEFELSQTFYDWQSNAASRNFLAVWPDGYAVMCFTQATDANYSDRGTGLLIWDPAVGEWEFTESRVESVKTGFGAIARYKENGLALVAHTSGDCRLFLVEDFREGNRDFGQGIVLPTTGEDGRTYDPCWPAVQCSGENLDIVHIITTEYSLVDPFENVLLYSRYENNDFTVVHRILPEFSAEQMGGGGSNIAYFLQYDPAKPNRVSFIINDAWTDGKAVISENNGETWTDRVYYQHPGIHTTFEDVSFHYPRWVAATFDDNDNLNIVYEWNGSTGEPGSGSYYPTVGGVGFWSETLPKNEMCIGGIGNVGEPFVMDSSYLQSDLYYSEWYWSDALHDPLPEYFGELQIIDVNGDIVPYDGEMPEIYYWFDLSDTDAKTHGAYNSGIAAFPSMVMDGNRIFAFWSMIAGDGATMYYDGTNNYYRIFSASSMNGGQTWTVKHVLDNVSGVMHLLDEMVYGQVIPYIYHDEQGEYLWYCYANDSETGTFVQSDETVPDNNFYLAEKIYISDIVGVEENGVEAPAATLSVYPNPANGSFTMTLDTEADVNIYNAVGQLVKSYKSVKSLEVNLEAGIYFVQSGNQTQKVVVF